MALKELLSERQARSVVADKNTEDLAVGMDHQSNVAVVGLSEMKVIRGKGAVEEHAEGVLDHFFRRDLGLLADGVPEARRRGREINAGRVEKLHGDEAVGEGGDMGRDAVRDHLGGVAFGAAAEAGVHFRDKVEHLRARVMLDGAGRARLDLAKLPHAAVFVELDQAELPEATEHSRKQLDPLLFCPLHRLRVGPHALQLLQRQRAILERSKHQELRRANRRPHPFTFSANRVQRMDRDGQF